MPYYGDYYGAGDPGLFSFAKKALGAVVKAVLPGPVRTVVDVASKLGGGSRRAVISSPVSAPIQTFAAPRVAPGAPRGVRRAKASAPKRRRAARARRKLKFGSPAWRRKYMR